MSLIKSACALVIAITVMACTPQVQTRGEVKGSPSIEKKEFIASDGASLPLRSWVPEKTPHAVILALHGFNDYSNAFALPGEYFSEHDIAFYAYDQRGFGGTSQKGIWAGQENLTLDIKEAIAAIHMRYPQVPVFLLGESMGGAAVIATFASKEVETDGVILVAPALWGGETFNIFYRSVLWTIAHIMPEQQFTGRNLKVLATDNIPLLREMGKDPLVQKSARADAIYGMVHLMDSAYTNINAISVPVLLLYGKNDQVIPYKPIRKSLAHITASCAFVEYANGYHMLLRDLQRQKVYDDIHLWIQYVLNPSSTYHAEPCNGDDV